jgi:predicted component of type VI protein secretion system
MSAMKALLLVVQGHPPGKHLVFGPGEYYFGRGEECHVRPNSAMVSRQHCMLRVNRAGVSIKDLGSRNGTLVNGALLQQEQRLRPGDQIQIGPLVFELRLEPLPGVPTSPTDLEPGPPPLTETFPVIDLPEKPDGPDSTKDTRDHPSLDVP